MRCLERSPTDRMLALAVTARLCFAALSSRPGGGRALMEPGPSRFGSRPRFRSRYAEKYEIVLRNPRVLSGTNPDRPCCRSIDPDEIFCTARKVGSVIERRDHGPRV